MIFPLSIYLTLLRDTLSFFPRSVTFPMCSGNEISFRMSKDCNFSSRTFLFYSIGNVFIFNGNNLILVFSLTVYWTEEKLWLVGDFMSSSLSFLFSFILEQTYFSLLCISHMLLVTYVFWFFHKIRLFSSAPLYFSWISLGLLLFQSVIISGLCFFYFIF